jgi:hypothetical protein
VPSRLDYFLDLAQKVSRCTPVTTGVRYAGTYQGVPSASDAARRIISSDLASQNLAGTAADAPSSAFDFEWVYVRDSAEQRRVVGNGYGGYKVASAVLTGHNAGADALIVGQLVLDRALSATPWPGTRAYILGQFPALATESLPGLFWAINEALQVMHWPRKVAITATDATTRYDLTSVAAWAKRQEQLIRVFGPDPSDGSGPPTMGGRSWIEPDGEQVYLHIPATLNAGEVFTAQLRCPCSAWILVKRTARASVTVTAGAITAVTLVDGGTGYSGSATIAFGGAGSGASATVTVAGGAVTGFSGLVGGSGYVQATTTATISAPTTTTWTASTVGLVNDEDEALPEVDRVTAVAYWQLALRMSRRGPKAQRGEWVAEAKAAAEAAAPFVQWQNEPQTPTKRQPYILPMPPTGRRRRLRAVGAGGGYRWP